MKRKAIGLIGLAAFTCFLTTCGNQPKNEVSYPSVKSARALSTHYVLVQFDEPANALAEDAANYLIVDSQQAQLGISAVTLSADRTEAMLTTQEQQAIQYQLAMGDPEQFAALGRVLPIGALGFLGTSVREPFLESAVALSDTEVLLTFSTQMDKETAETVAYYEIADPDGNTDVDIRITAASLQEDWTTVLLTTTPQQNLQYQVRVTNVKRRFSCDDEGRVFLDSTSQSATCSATYRPKDADGVLSSFVLTSRTQIDRAAPTDPNAAGLGGSVGLDAFGAGVRRPVCNGGVTGIEGTNGSDSDEELIITADRPELGENIVLGMRNMDFVTDMPVLFISSSTAAGFDYVVNTTEVRAAFTSGPSSGDIAFANMPSLPDGLLIDAIKIRETNGELWLNSVCGLATNRRLIDPTRNTAFFFGIPPVDEAGPRVVRAESISNTEVVVSFSEPLNSEAANPLNFTIDPPLTVIDAVLGKYDTQVILTTSPQLAGVLYTVTVENVMDKAGNLIDPSANSATFSYTGGPDGLGADVLPRVAGAASTGNTGVLVTFTKPMGDSALVPGNYFIVQQNVNPEVGALLVLAAEFLTPQRDAVQLTTSSQNEVTYFLRVLNARDLFGNQIAPPQLLVDPATAIFPGTPFSCGADECEEPDQDGDGLSDHDELRGYVVTVELANGQQITREVTSDIFVEDTDADGLTDAEEKRLGSDPRSKDTDGDQISDYVEYNFVYSDQNDQDTDDDGIDDLLEIDFSKTNATVADSDGDGFDDGDELFVMNRDPRIADLPAPRISIASVRLQVQENFSFTDESGQSQSEESSTQSTLASSQETKITNKVGFQLGVNGKLGFEGGYDGGIVVKATAEVGANLGFSFEHTNESGQSAMSSYQASLTKGLSVTGSSASTREVVGGRVDAMVTIGNLSDVAFAVSDLELTVSAPDPVDRTKFLPVATLVPNSTLVTGNPATYNIGVLDGSERGPIMFSSRDVFPTLVEDLMRDPRGLLVEFANYNLSDEFERNFAFASQTARDRTVGLIVDFGEGVPKRYFVAYAAVRFNQSSCDPEADPGCDIVGGFAGFSDAGIPPYGGVGDPPGLPLEYILEHVLQLRRSAPVITAVWLPQPAFLPETTDTHLCVGGFNDGAECDPGNGDADCEDGLDDGVCSNAVAADGILVGPNGVSDSIAQGDDVQLIPFGIDGLPQDAVVINAGANGVLESSSRPDDVDAVITGYATTKTCGPDTPSSIRPGPNGVVESLRDPFSDDEQLVDFGEPAAFAIDIIGPGLNGFIDTAPGGDDVYVGPGIPCDADDDCVSPGICDGQEVLFRYERRARGQFGRVWAVLVPEDSLIGLDFRKVVLRPGEVLNLGFIQDLDRDGLISDVEGLFGSSDTRQDTDGDGLDDFSEVRVGWEVGVEGESIRQVYPDPRLRDTDGDGLADREEQDFRRVQCECDGGADDGEACTYEDEAAACVDGGNDGMSCSALGDCPGGTCEPPDTMDVCRGGTCVNVADLDLPASTPCSSNLTASRIDPRRRDTDGDGLNDSLEVLGWLTQAAVIDPLEVIIAGPNRKAESTACPDDVCVGGSKDGERCRFDRDCPTLKVCTKGINDGIPCVNDIECLGQTPALSGLCEEADATTNPPADPLTPTPYQGVCDRTGCDDVQVVPVGTEGLDDRTVVVAPGEDGMLDSSSAAVGDDDDVLVGDLRAATHAAGDDQQVAVVDLNRVLVDTTLGRTIIRPGINGVLDTLQTLGDDVIALGQFIQTTNPLTQDTDVDQVDDGFEGMLGSDPRNPVDGGLLADTDGDGLTDQQEQTIGWVIVVDGVGGSEMRTVYSNPNVPDSDLDGLPDLAENHLRTDPRKQDTDGDTLSDFDEVTEAQLTSLERFNDLFLGYSLAADLSAAFGTSPLNCDSDGDHLADDFELLEGFSVSLRADNGIIVFRAFTDPTNEDTDFDGLPDGAEFKHTVGCVKNDDCRAAGSTASCNAGTCATMFATDPTDFDSDGDGRKDGDECSDALAPPSGCADLTQALAHCATNPLVPDKQVKIRFVELIVDRADEDGDGGRADITWQFGAHRSDEAFPGAIWAPPLTTTPQDCAPQGAFENCSGGECGLKEGDHVVFGSDAVGLDFCTMNSQCNGFTHPFDHDANGSLDTYVGTCFLGHCFACYQVNFLGIFGGPLICVPSTGGDGIPDNERTFSLRPGQGILIYGEVREFDNCEAAACLGGPNEGASCTNNPSTCCSDVCGTCPDIPDSDDVCAGGPKAGEACTENSDCCETQCGICQATGEPASHVTYFKSLSFESVTEGFTVDVGSMNDASTNNAFRATIVVEIMVE